MTEKETALKNLNTFLETNTPKTASMFEELFKKQQNEINDDELEEAVKNGFDDVIQKWREEYKAFVENQLTSVFQESMKTAASTVEQKSPLLFDVNEPYIKRQLDFLTKRFLNQLNDEAERTVKVIMQKCQEEHLTPKQTARMIHLTMGLYPRQAIALWNYTKKYYPQYLSTSEINREWESTIQNKMRRKNMTRDEAIEDIYNTAIKSNQIVNSKFGLE